MKKKQVRAKLILSAFLEVIIIIIIIIIEYSQATPLCRGKRHM